MHKKHDFSSVAHETIEKNESSQFLPRDSTYNLYYPLILAKGNPDIALDESFHPSNNIFSYGNTIGNKSANMVTCNG